MESRDSKEESSMVLEPIQKASIIVNGASSNFGDSRKLVLYVPGAVKTREVPLNGPKLYIPVNQFSEGKPIPQPHLSSASVMVVSQMVHNGYEHGKGLGLPLQGIVDPINPMGEPSPDFPLQNDVDEMCQGIKEMFYYVNMTQMGEGTSHMDVQFVGPNIQLNNWEATPLPTRKESW
ncbi:hypothetical protein KY284_036191 [Solanum tuberosum]|nr:hypothetical protein KY284_036191 [Solanum tuberosum]